MLHNHIMYSYVKQNYNFTSDDKKECLGMLEKILKAVELTKLGGILFLDDKSKSVENPYLREALTLLVYYSTAPETIETILAKYIFFDNLTSKEVLELLIIKEGVDFIVKGDNPIRILFELKPFFGKEFESEVQKIYENIHNSKNKKDFII